MFKLRVALPLVLLCAALVPAAATAAGPSPVSFSISSNAQYLGPTDILVQTTVTCDPSLGGAYVFLNVFEASTGARGQGFFEFVCTGSAQTIVVPVTGAGFTPGRAYAEGSACGGFSAPPFIGFCDSASRQLQITL
jgi:hypothetical protein